MQSPANGQFKPGEVAEKAHIKKATAALDQEISPPSGPREDTPFVTESEPTSAPGLYETVAGAAQRNPLLVVGAAMAVGALTVMALQRNSRPRSSLRAFERTARRQAADLERTMQRGLQQSGVAKGFEDLSAALAARLSNADTASLEKMADQFTTLLARARDRIGRALE